MTGANQTVLAQQMNTNNMANANTSGFRADLNAFRSMDVFGPGFPTRTYAMTERPNIDLTLGAVRNTDRDLDVAVEGDGWIGVQSRDGSEGYTRAGNLSIQAGGILVTGGGLPVLGNGGPIAIPQAEHIEIGSDGTISIRPVGQPSTVLVVVDRIKLVKPEPKDLMKSNDGLIRLKSGATAEADGSVRVVSGALETSNVNIVNAMVSMINLSRSYEMQVKMMKTAEENDRASDQMLRMS
jgi:flagellar basal-body rod protein FlgF